MARQTHQQQQNQAIAQRMAQSPTQQQQKAALLRLIYNLKQNPEMAKAMEAALRKMQR